MTKVIARGDIYRGKAQVVRVCGGSAARVWLRSLSSLQVGQTQISTSGLERQLACHHAVQLFLEHRAELL